MGQTLALSQLVPTNIQRLTSGTTSSSRITHGDSNTERHRRLSEEEEAHQEFIDQQHQPHDSFHHDDLESGVVTSQSSPQQQQQQHTTSNHTSSVLLFGGAPMMIDGLLNYEFFNGINNVNELVSLFGYYGRIEGLFGRNLDHYEQQHQEHTPFEYKDTMILRNDVNIQKNSLILVNDQNGFSLSFKFDVRTNFIDECKVKIYLKAKEIRNLNPTNNGPVVKYESSTVLPSKIFNHFEIQQNDGAQYYTSSSQTPTQSTTLGNTTMTDLSSSQMGTSSDDDHSLNKSSRRDYHNSTSLEYNVNHSISLETIFTHREEMQYNISSNNNSVTNDSHSSIEMESTLIPMVIEIQSETCSQFSLCSIVDSQRSSDHDSNYSIKVNKQKLMIGNELYEVAEIYHQTTNHHSNTEQADTTTAHSPHDDEEDENLCVICISEPATTVVLPCGHLSLCTECANALRSQTNKCPICRQTVESAIQLPSRENM